MFLILAYITVWDLFLSVFYTLRQCLGPMPYHLLFAKGYALKISNPPFRRQVFKSKLFYVKF